MMMKEKKIDERRFCYFPQAFFSHFYRNNKEQDPSVAPLKHIPETSIKQITDIDDH
jgi:hypothetical protein